MGCFQSTNKISKQQTQLPLSKSPPHTHSLPEETVKEVVLTETQKPRIPSSSPSPFIKSAPLLLTTTTTTHSHKTHDPALSTEDLSEQLSVKSTFSEVSSSVPEKLRQNSPAKTKNRNFSGEGRQRERTPVRSSEPSPGRIRPGSGPGCGRKRESGESSGRRSRSPVTRLECGSSRMGSSLSSGSGRSNSVRKTGKSPGRGGHGSGSGSGERVRRVGQDVDGKWPPPTNNELIENPLVSLECFIFL